MKIFILFLRLTFNKAWLAIVRSRNIAFFKILNIKNKVRRHMSTNGRSCSVAYPSHHCTMCRCVIIGKILALTVFSAFSKKISLGFYWVYGSCSYNISPINNQDLQQSHRTTLITKISLFYSAKCASHYSAIDGATFGWIALVCR